MRLKKSSTDALVSHVKLITMKVRLPTFWNDTVKNFFNLIIWKVLIWFKGQKFVKPVVDFLPPGILRKSSGFGVFAEIFSKNIVIPSKEIPFFGEAHPRFWAIIAKFGFFGVIRMARIETRITEYSVVRLFGSPE
jgi:hypothetical protein